MMLRDLLSVLPEHRVAGDVQQTVGALRYDSRRVQAKDVFFAWRGQKTDGHSFIPEVRERRAAAVVVEDKNYLNEAGLTTVLVPDARRALAQMAAAYYDFPARKLQCVGITGTKGKTTTSFILKHLLENSGLKTGLIGTVRYEIGERILPASRTTPEGSDVQELLSQMHQAGCQAVVMEVSSHALDQGRVAPIEFTVGVFTNLQQDHLDYHGTIEAYFAAKQKLFQQVQSTAVLNADDPRSAVIRAQLTPEIRVIEYSQAPDSLVSVRAQNVTCVAQGTSLDLIIGTEKFAVRLPYLGKYNVANVLAAVSAAVALGLKPLCIAEALQTAPAVPGRMEFFTSANGVTVVVDYAHTEEALRQVLQTLRDLHPRRLLVVVGCGGDRDRTKRPLMAQVATTLADETIFTADNPRSEKVETIFHDMIAGVSSTASYELIPDRKEAIALALAKAQTGDVICVAGKGHETTQEIAGTFYPFDDRQVVAEFLLRRGL